MERRELLKWIAAVTGGAVVGADVFLSGCTTGTKKTGGFSSSVVELLDEVGETIIPATDTPGAKAAKIGEFMKVMVTDCYTEKEQEVFMKGTTALDEACKKMHGKNFMECSATQRHDLLVSLEKEAKEYNKARDERNKTARDVHDKTNKDLPWKDQKEFEGEPIHYYSMMKQLTLHGYFTSEPGATRALRHVAVPGHYEGNVPYKKGEKAWA